MAAVGDEELNRIPSEQGAQLCRRPAHPLAPRRLTTPSFRSSLLVHVLPKPGVMDPVAQSVMSAIEDFGLKAEVVRTLKKYWIEGLATDRIGTLCAQRSWPTTPSSR